MDSLVGYGPSSESEDDRDGAVTGVTGGAGEDPSAEEGADISATTRTRNFLLEADSGSSDADSESDPEDCSSPSQPSHMPSAPSAAGQPPPAAPVLGSLRPSKLPPPSLSSPSDSSSVFSNPFKAQAEQKLSALQKHVPLTLEPRPSQIGGRRMCVLYRKDGKCRFGINCKFAHDSDLQTPVVPTQTHTPVCEGAVSVKGSQNLQQEKKEDAAGGRVKKRRVGLSNSLIPPKRAMKQYNLQRTRGQVNMP